MSPEEFRREIRTDPLTRESRIILPDFQGNLYESQISTSGRLIDKFDGDGVTIKVTTPEIPLLLLEERPELVGDGVVYDRSSGFGADERFSLQGLFNASGLELLIKAFIKRSEELQAKVPNGDSLRQFYAYATYLVKESSLTGRLLVSREVAPTIKREIRVSSSHFYEKNRCLYCDIRNEESKNASKAESRVVLCSPHYIAFLPFAPEGQYELLVIPQKHISKLSSLSPEKIKDIATVIYQLLEGIKRDSTKTREIDSIDVVFHGAPIYTDSDVKIFYGTVDISSIYHLHLEISPSMIQPKGASYGIPRSGWSVVSGRPKDTAYRLRQALNH